MARTMHSFEVVAKEWNPEEPDFPPMNLELLPKELWKVRVRGDVLCVSTHCLVGSPSERFPEGERHRTWFRAALIPGDSRDGFEDLKG